MVKRMAACVRRRGIARTAFRLACRDAVRLAAAAESSAERSRTVRRSQCRATGMSLWRIALAEECGSAAGTGIHASPAWKTEDNGGRMKKELRPLFCLLVKLATDLRNSGVTLDALKPTEYADLQSGSCETRLPTIPPFSSRPKVCHETLICIGFWIQATGSPEPARCDRVPLERP